MASVISCSCGQDKKTNPLLVDEFDTPWQTPPFGSITTDDFLEAFEEGIARSRREAEEIAANPEAPTFANTVEALERQGELLGRTSTIFFALKGAETSDKMEEIAEKVIPQLTELSNDISLDPRLYARVKAVYDYYHDRLWEVDPLEAEQWMLLDNTYKGFVRSGAGLADADKETYRKITGELSMLSLRFEQNVLAATNGYALNIPVADSARLEGMPAFVMEAMAETAAERGEKGWTVTLHAPSYIPFMTYCRDRELKQQVWAAYGSRCYGGGPEDNDANVNRIAELRMELAKLMGYATYADFVLEERMAGSVGDVYKLLNELLASTKRYADDDFRMLRDYAAADGVADFRQWDWGYYEEKYRAEKYDLNQEQVKPYFKLENAEKGIFLLAGKLYGITFQENKDIPVYHPDVRAFEVYDGDGSFLAVLYMDYFPRATKQGGAWMTSYRDMYATADGTEVRPIISVCCNFTKPTATAPSLLTFDEVNTLLHEFGHALHGIFAEGRYASLTGTAVYRDFVELPSQIMENWATEKEYLDMWAVHYQSGEPIPAALVERIVAAKSYLEPYQNIRQLSFGLNDMAWHTITAPVETGVKEFESAATEETLFFPPDGRTCMSPAFTHIFSGGYAAGYYSYKWAEVLEADAFSLFGEKGIFDRGVAESFRRNILSKGGTEDPMALYVRFRGHEPDTKPLIEKIIGK